MLLSDDLDQLWSQLARLYTDNPSGFMLTPKDIQALLGRVFDAREAALILEQKIPPPPPEIKGDNVIDFRNLAKRRV